MTLELRLGPDASVVESQVTALVEKVTGRRVVDWRFVQGRDAISVLLDDGRRETIEVIGEPPS